MVVLNSKSSKKSNSLHAERGRRKFHQGTIYIYRDKITVLHVQESWNDACWDEDLPVYISTAWYIGIQVFFYDFTYKNMDEVLGGWFTCM